MPRIAVDAMGGDHAPDEIVLGALDAAEAGLTPILVGDIDLVRSILDGFDGIRVVHAPEIIEMHEDPARAIREKKNASVTVAARLVADGDADGLVSAGSTGAALAAAAFVIGRIDGVTRPAIASLFPSGQIVVDAGANLVCKADNLAQFAVMGVALAEIVNGRVPARVGLVNIGQESGKGRDLEKQAFSTLSALQGIEFVGNVEGGELALDVADVLVTDGFTGNVLLKTAEGASRLTFNMLTEELAAVGDEAVHSAVERVAKHLDPETIGGAHLLGTRAVVVIAHGSSTRRAISGSIEVASIGVDARLPDRIATGIASL